MKEHKNSFKSELFMQVVVRQIRKINKLNPNCVRDGLEIPATDIMK